RCAELQIQLSEAVATLAAQKELVAKLEHDLSTIQALSAVPRPEAEVPRPWAGSQSWQRALSSPRGRGHCPPPLGPKILRQTNPKPFHSSMKKGLYSTAPVVLLLSEGDRCCQPCGSALCCSILWGCFLPDGGAQGSVLVLGVPVALTLPLLPQGSSRDDTEQRYSSQYEERLDPFSSFSRKERQRKYLSLSPWDKATLSMGRLILSNKTARTVAFFYTLLLHCLVFLVLYKTAWSESVGRDCSAFCAKK
ncbi:CASP protein, partial [Agelaius phoeniceus]|nr:CASP protein [Agelaius phoeniceus]